MLFYIILSFLAFINLSCGRPPSLYSDRLKSLNLDEHKEEDIDEHDDLPRWHNDLKEIISKLIVGGYTNQEIIEETLPMINFVQKYYRVVITNISIDSDRRPHIQFVKKEDLEKEALIVAEHGQNYGPPSRTTPEPIDYV
ncbi:uncharacterized protein LOC128680656 [Plodia interpunctella]|uniref:uncharacterized protein LOC128680656 n=1 Tax=Plodia interpunctella TaxID=58824 RepID=UPI002368E26F|nr:uncharacterized protein LOC128680656 [Plodia interpunctella]